MKLVDLKSKPDGESSLQDLIACAISAHLHCRGATASGRSRDARARKAARAWKLQYRTRAQINKRARKEKYKKPLK